MKLGVERLDYKAPRHIQTRVKLRTSYEAIRLYASLMAMCFASRPVRNLPEKERLYDVLDNPLESKFENPAATSVPDHTATFDSRVSGSILPLAIFARTSASNTRWKRKFQELSDLNRFTRIAEYCPDNQPAINRFPPSPSVAPIHTGDPPSSCTVPMTMRVTGVFLGMTEDDFDKLRQKIQGHEGSLSDQSAQIAELQRKVAELNRAIEALQAKFKASFLD
jgi:hypothetical protein